MNFLWPQNLWFLLALPVLVLAYFWLLRRKKKLAVRFARRHPGTLIVVQGDHETGGLTIENPDTADESGDEISKEDGPFTVKGTNLQVFADWTTNQHTGADTPITASGPTRPSTR